jgi:hypothetical protein
MRMAGYDVRAMDLNSRKWVTNWADNASGRFLYTDAHTEGFSAYAVRFSDVKPRQNNWLRVNEFQGDATISFTTKDMRGAFFNGQNRLVMHGGFTRASKPSDTHKLAHDISLTQSTVNVYPLGRLKSDFQRARYILPGMSGIPGASLVAPPPLISQPDPTQLAGMPHPELPADPGLSHSD